MAIVKLKATDGTPIEYDDERMAGSGGVKDVYFSPDPPLISHLLPCCFQR